MTPHIRRLLDAYGPQRCCWETDITQFTEELTFLSESDKDWIMGRALLVRLNWA